MTFNHLSVVALLLLMHAPADAWPVGEVGNSIAHSLFEHGARVSAKPTSEVVNKVRQTLSANETDSAAISNAIDHLSAEDKRILIKGAEAVYAAGEIMRERAHDADKIWAEEREAINEDECNGKGWGLRKEISNVVKSQQCLWLKSEITKHRAPSADEMLEEAFSSVMLSLCIVPVQVKPMLERIEVAQSMNTLHEEINKAVNDNEKLELIAAEMMCR